MHEFKAEAVLMDAMFLGAAYIARELGVKPLVGAGGNIDCMASASLCRVRL